MHNRMIKVAYSNRIIPHYRSPVFEDLSKRDIIDLTVYYGNGLPVGSQANDNRQFKFNAVKLFTIPFNFTREKSQQLRTLHPTLIFHLIKGKYDIIIVEPSTNLLNNISVYIYCNIFNKKMIWYESGVASDRLKSTLRKNIIDPILRMFIKKSTAFITYNSFGDRYLIENYGIVDSKIFRAQNALDTSSITSDIIKYKDLIDKAKYDLGINNMKVVTFIGGVEKRKRVENIILAAKHYSIKYEKCTALIVGDGPDLDYYKKEYSPNQYPVVYTGKRIDDAVLMLLCSDIVILPGEGGLAINHAFACGKPFIGTNECVSGNDSIRDYVFDGYNGYVAKENSIDDLVDKIKLVFTHYNKLCTGAKESSEKFTIPKLVDGMIDAINFTIAI